jgi:probable rRNA maturation factor
MNAHFSIEIIDHQHVIHLPELWITWLESRAFAALPLVLDQGCGTNHLLSLTHLDVALVDEDASAQAHRDFMNVDGATDVITFLHGELVICPSVAQRQAIENEEPFLRELLRYVIHGILHLAGHDDRIAEQRANMEAAQEAIVAKCWHDVSTKLLGNDVFDVNRDNSN